MTDLLDCLELEAGGSTESECAGTVIWMHGLGADATDFEPLVDMLDLDRKLRFVFPNAPVRPVTINAGAQMRAWYDIDPGAPLAGEDDIRVSFVRLRLKSYEKSNVIP